MKRPIAAVVSGLVAAASCLSPSPAHARVDEGTLEVLGFVGGTIAAGVLVLGVLGMKKLMDRAKRRRARALERIMTVAPAGPATDPADRALLEPAPPRPAAAGSPPASGPSPASLPASSWVRRAVVATPAKPAVPSSAAPAPAK